MSHELSQSLSLLPCRSEPWIWIAKPGQSNVNKFICRRRFHGGALSIEGPVKNELRRAILFSSHASEPMVNERGLPDPSPGDNRHNVDILVCPGTIQERDVLLSTKDIASGDGQS